MNTCNESISNETFEKLLERAVFLSSTAIAGYCNVYNLLTNDTVVYVIIDNVQTKEKTIVYKTGGKE